MGGKKNAPPKKTEEEKAEEKRLKVCTNMLKAAKENELAKVQKAVESEGADINFANEVRAKHHPGFRMANTHAPAVPCLVDRSQQGQTCAHVAAAFGALDVLRYLYKNGALFDVQNSKKQTPLDAARFIGEEDSVLLIEALMDGALPASLLLPLPHPLVPAFVGSAPAPNSLNWFLCPSRVQASRVRRLASARTSISTMTYQCRPRPRRRQRQTTGVPKRRLRCRRLLLRHRLLPPAVHSAKLLHDVVQIEVLHPSPSMGLWVQPTTNISISPCWQIEAAFWADSSV